MSEPPPRPGKAGDDLRAEPEKKSGAEDPLQSNELRRRTTAIGLAPAPHLGGLAGSPGAAARAEAEARKQRIAARLASARGSVPPARPSSHPHEEIDEQIPRGATGPPPPALEALGVEEPSVERARDEARLGQKTLLMAPLTTKTTKLTAERPRPPSPSIPTDGSAPTILAAPPQAAGPRPEPSAPFVEAERVTPAPTTERMLPVSRPPTAVVATSSLAVRAWEPPPSPPRRAPMPVDPKLVVVTEPNSSRADAFRALRDNLLAKGLPRVVAVTSANLWDGKTTCAANLALALAEHAETKVLLLEGNFFDAELARLFNFARAQTVPVDLSLTPHQVVSVTPGFHVAGVVRTEASAGWRFEQTRFDALLDRLCRVSYDFIVIDTPALHETPAVAPLVAAADGVVLAVRSGKSTTSALKKAAEQIPPKKRLGIALLDAPPKGR